MSNELIYPSTQVSQSPGSYDSFGRIRTSEEYTLGDYHNIYSLNPFFIQKTAINGSITHRSNESAARLSVTSDVGSLSIFQSRMYHHYIPGKSQLIKATFTFGLGNGIRRRVGYFDSNNGIYLERNESGILNFVIRSKVSGNVDDTRKIPQSQWNIDKCDGTGDSGFAFSPEYSQILWIDFQWLGVGRVRCGFVHKGQNIIAHEFYNDDAFPGVYMSTPNLPVRYEIENVSGAGGYMDAICASVTSEGGYSEFGKDWAIESPSYRSINAGATLPLLAIRLKNSFSSADNRTLVRLLAVNVFSESANVAYSINKLSGNGSLTGGTGVWTPVHANSAVEYRADATTYTDGEIIGAGFAAAADQGSNKAGSVSISSTQSNAKSSLIAQNYDSTDSEVFVIVAKNIGAAATNIMGSLQWREVY